MNSTPSGYDRHIEHTAADWWARLRDPALPEQALVQWSDWLEADPRHAHAFDSVAALAESVGEMNARERDAIVERFAAPVRALPTRRPRLAMGVAASVAAVAIAGAGLFLAFHTSTDAVSHQYASERAGHRDIALPDGSSIELGAATSVTARYGKDERAIDLDDGEAYFHVAHATRPFIVNAGPLRIRDLGTAFNVRRTGDRVTVTVTEGRVRVSPAQGDGNGPVELGAGSQVSFDPETQAMRFLNVDAGSATSWRDNRLEFVNEPLDSVVANVNRYATRPIRLADPALGKLTFTGTVQVDTIDSWIAALPRVFPVRVDSYADRLELARQTSTARSIRPR
ncbi:MAG: Protein FecR [Luteibacter sp.]|uniref:FecR family protein n=1 Tax=Luteibacter sp. TaxID=1886636 RepID=UPI001383606F|nr:FecR domain-containing protein [Luteibacter sp.]KAF1006272.1 MAG: Protein FecR [Luteibacter sp.]